MPKLTNCGVHEFIFTRAWLLRPVLFETNDCWKENKQRLPVNLFLKEKESDLPRPYTHKSKRLPMYKSNYSQNYFCPKWQIAGWSIWAGSQLSKAIRLMTWVCKTNCCETWPAQSSNQTGDRKWPHPNYRSGTTSDVLILRIIAICIAAENIDMFSQSMSQEESCWFFGHNFAINQI